MTDLQAAVNDALERVSLSLLDLNARAVALAPFGEAVAATAEALHHESVSEPPPSGDETDAGRRRVETMLAARHPWLSARALGNLVTSYLYNWK